MRLDGRGVDNGQIDGDDGKAVVVCGAASRIGFERGDAAVVGDVVAA